MLRSGELRVRQTRDDTLIPGRTHERADQYYRGVRVFGADVARQLRRRRDRVDLRDDLRGHRHRPDPRRSTKTRARAAVEARAASVAPTTSRGRTRRAAARRWWLRARLARARRASARDIRQYFVDAPTGASGARIQRPQDRRAAVGRETGVLGDTKKISVRAAAGQFQRERRPPAPGDRDLRHEGRSSTHGPTS